MCQCQKDAEIKEFLGYAFHLTQLSIVRDREQADRKCDENNKCGRCKAVAWKKFQLNWSTAEADEFLNLGTDVLSGHEGLADENGQHAGFSNTFHVVSRRDPALAHD